jgi:hypothetical protein
MPSASFSHRAHVNAPRSVVWARLQEPDAWAEIGPIDKVWGDVHDAAGLLRSFEWSTRAAGREVNGKAVTSQAEADRLMVVDLSTSEVVGAVEVTLSDGAIEVVMSLRPVGLLASVFFGSVASAVGGGLAGHVDDFAAHFSA